jgi:hypothetical protein
VGVRYRIRLAEKRMYSYIVARTPSTTFLRNPYLWLEVIISLLFTPPVIDTNAHVPLLRGYLTIDDSLTVLSLVRLYHLPRLFATFSWLLSPVSQRFTYLHDFKINTMFILHAYKRQRYGAFLIYTFLVSLMTFCLLLTIAERNEQEEFGDERNTWWLVSVTLSSTGYGDLSPKASAGRIVDGVC